MARFVFFFLLLAQLAGAQPAIDQYLSERAEAALAARSTTVANLTRPQAEQRRVEIRNKILTQIGGLPTERPPLNPRITGGFERTGYRVENLLYESLPKLMVTANVYVPTTGPGPFPALIGVAGHSANGKASSTYQHVWISMARRGYVVLAFDPPGQGERLELLDPATSIPRAGIGTSEHTHIGLQLLLTGSHIARYEAWDGIRAFDYLTTRNDVDPRRIAVAGNSGGGTQAAYLSVLEPRLAAIVSSCYMTSWKELWYKPGPQDGEQVFPNFLRDQLDFPDFAYAAAPKPFLMTTAIQDFFPIAGARRTYQQIKGFFGLFDAEAKAGYFEYDDTHGWSKPRREAAYRFLDQWLKGDPNSPPEAPLTTEPEQLLYATPTGQVHSSVGGDTTQAIHAREALRVYPTRTASRSGLTRQLITTRLGMQSTTRRFFDANLQLPENGAVRHPAILALNANKADIAEMIASGYAVAAVTLPVSSPLVAGYTGIYQTASRALLVGETLLGIQLQDVLNTYTELTTNPKIDPRRIRIYGRGNAAVVALHAAYFTPGLQSVALEAMPLSWLAITQARLQRGLVEIIVPGVLKDYDLPDVAKALAPRSLWLIDTRDPAGLPMMRDKVLAEYPGAHVGYRAEGWKFAEVFKAWLM